MKQQHQHSVSPRIAIVHDWLIDWAGSERVLQQILACYPHADLFALVDFLPSRYRTRILGKFAASTFIQRLPWTRSHLYAYLPLMPIAIEQLDLSGYDLVISSSHAVAKGVITSPDQLHLSYVHSPMRYAWDQQHQYLQGAHGRGLRGLALRSLLHYLRTWDTRTANGVDAFAVNSKYVARRVSKTYRRSARVIYPPVEIERFAVKDNKEGFYLCAGRAMPYKRFDIVVDAFTQMSDRRLVVVGDGPEIKRIQTRAGPNVKFAGYQSDSDLTEYLQNAKALVFAAEEDFGILPVEAQACGTPVIAFARGGALETIFGIDSSTPSGIFFAEQTPDAIVRAVAEFELRADQFSPSACRASAERFSIARFKSEFQAFVTSEVHQWRERMQA